MLNASSYLIFIIYKVTTVIIPILWIRKLKHREAKGLTQGLTAIRDGVRIQI